MTTRCNEGKKQRAGDAESEMKRLKNCNLLIL